MIYPIQIVIFHSYGTAYQRVTYSISWDIIGGEHMYLLYFLGVSEDRTPGICLGG